jgi:PPE-repeat protein
MPWVASTPEIMAAQMYYSPGSGSLHLAASELATLAGELDTIRSGWQSTFADLEGSWQGTGAAAAQAAADAYLAWLTALQSTVLDASARAETSALAFDTAKALVVDPATVATNRADFAAWSAVLAASMGMNVTALNMVNTLTAEYAGFSVTDSGAMMAYEIAADNVASGLAADAANVPPGLGTINLAADNPAIAAADPAASLGATASDLVNSVDGFLGTPAFFNAFNGAVNTAAWFVTNGITTSVSLGHVLAGAAVPAAAVSDVVPAGAGGVVEGTMVSSVAPLGLRANGMAGVGASAGVGEATTVGKLTVPATWAAATQTEAELASSVAPLEGSGWIPATEAGGAPVMGAGMPGAAGAKGAGAFGGGPRYGFKPIVMPKQVVV